MIINFLIIAATFRLNYERKMHITNAFLICFINNAFFIFLLLVLFLLFSFKLIFYSTFLTLKCINFQGSYLFYES